MIRVSRLPAWQQAIIKKHYPRKKLLSEKLYEAILQLDQCRCSLPKTPSKQPKS